MKSRVKFLLGFLAMCLLFLTSCGSKQETGDSKQEGKSEKEKVLRVGVAAEHKPWCYKDGDKIVGIDVDILNEAAKRMGGYKVELELASFEGMFGLLDTGKVDTVAQQITITDKRKEKYIFSEIYAYNPYKLLVGENDNSITKLEDLKGKIFAVGPAGADLEYIEDYKKKNDPEDKIKVLISDISGRELISQGKADATLYPVSAFDAMKKESGLPIKLVGDALYEEHNAYPFRKDVDKELLDKFNNAIKSMIEDGTLQKIYMEHFGVDLSKPGAMK